LREPTTKGDTPVTDLLTALASADAALATTDPDSLTGVVDKARALSMIEGVMQRLASYDEQLRDDLIASMETDSVLTPAGWLMREKRDRKITWRNADARDAARPAFVQALATNPETGELLPNLKRVVMRTMDMYERCFSVSNPKAAFRTELDLDVDEFREINNDTGYTLRLVTDPTVGQQ